MISVDEKTDIPKNGVDTLLLQHYSRVLHINKDRKSLISSGISDARLCRWIHAAAREPCEQNTFQ